MRRANQRNFPSTSRFHRILQFRAGLQSYGQRTYGDPIGRPPVISDSFCQTQQKNSLDFGVRYVRERLESPLPLIPEDPDACLPTLIQDKISTPTVVHWEHRLDSGSSASNIAYPTGTDVNEDFQTTDTDERFRSIASTGRDLSAFSREYSSKSKEELFDPNQLKKHVVTSSIQSDVELSGRHVYKRHYHDASVPQTESELKVLKPQQLPLDSPLPEDSSHRTSTLQSPATTETASKMIPSDVNYFPHFSCWLSLVHCLVYLSAIFLFGSTRWGSGATVRQYDRVRMPNLVVDNVCRSDPLSLLFALREADLIRLGARYAPCMQPDSLIERHRERQRITDRLSGCCIHRDGSGCYQTRHGRCSPSLSVWLHHNLSHRKGELDPKILPATQELVVYHRSNVSAGPVCGLDPEYCIEPSVEQDSTWKSDDVTNWPICHARRHLPIGVNIPSHMNCKVTGRPCCVGVRGKCIITTKEHCVFLHGLYHPKAALCSQVNCVERSCGMWGFVNHRHPDQGYRLFISLFLHVNPLVLVISLIVQLSSMRAFEHVMNGCRIAAIFFLSGLFGNTLSVLLHPHQIATGPTHMSILIAQLVDFFHNMQMLEGIQPGIYYIIIPMLLLFILGLTPLLDNTANMGSAIAGLLVYHVIAPVKPVFPVSSANRQLPPIHPLWRTALPRIVCGLTYLILLTAALLLMNHPTMTLPHCSWCVHLNCVPLFPGMCDHLEVHTSDQLDCVPDF